MVELELDTLHADGEHLILRGPDGQRYRLVIDESLRTAVRRDRPHLEALRAQGESTLRPRDIQARIRAGASAEEVAAEGGLAVESVRRFESPVQAERSWIAQQTQALPIGREVGAPTLGDLVVDRLAARGVTDQATWDAVRRAGEPWEVVVAFEAGGTVRRARWQVDLVTRSLTALDDESRWLSETELASRRGGRGRPFDVEDADRRGAEVVILEQSGADRTSEASSSAPAAVPQDRSEPAAHPEGGGGHEQDSTVGDSSPEVSQPAEAPDSPAATEELLDRLDAARGRRGPTARSQAPDDDAEAAPAPRTSALDDALFPVAPVLRLRSQEQAAATDEASSGDDEATADDQAPDEVPESPRPARTRPRARRTSVPSWDEIVFGAKQD